MRLIDAKELERLFNGQIEQGVGVIGAFDAFYDALQDTPTVDAVEVVRCKECKYSYADLDGLCCTYGVCVDSTVPEDFYCANGVRRGGGEDG